MPSMSIQSRSLLVGIAVVVVTVVISIRAYNFWVDIQDINQTVVFEQSHIDGERSSRPANEVARLDLFGKQQTMVKAPPVVPENLPETRLQLILRGVSSAEGENLSSQGGTNGNNQQDDSGALIEGPDQSTEFFRPGSNLPGNAKLHAVYADRIVIDRNGKLENLSFPQQWDNNSSSIGNFEPPESRTNVQSSGANRQDLSTAAGSFPQTVGDSSFGSQVFQTGEELDDDDLSADDGDVTQQQVEARLESLRDRIRQQQTQ